MKGHIRERGKNWVVVVDLGKDPTTGKRRQHWETVKGPKRDAQRRLREILTSVEGGAYVKPSRLNVGEWLQEWLKGYVATNCAPRTQASYAEVVRLHVAPALGQIPLTQLEPSQIQAFYAAKNGEGKVRTARYCHSLLRQALGHALKMGLVGRNAALACDPPRVERKTMTTLAAGDIPKFLEAVSSTPHYALFVTLLASGMRRGEVLALKWKNLDLNRGYAFVVESGYKLHGKYVTKQPKTASSRRRVALPASLVAVLQEHRCKQSANIEDLGGRLTDEDYVFCNHLGKPLDPTTLSHAFGNAIKKAELPHLRLHDLRHSYATLLLKAGQHPSVVAAQLGHSSVRTTLDVYSHVLPGLQEAAARSLETFLPRQLSEGNH
jgi:integrase